MKSFSALSLFNAISIFAALTAAVSDSVFLTKTNQETYPFGYDYGEVDTDAVLWRYQLKQGDITIYGKEQYCIRTAENMFWGWRYDQAVAYNKWCWSDERLFVEFNDDDTVTITVPKYKMYFSCDWDTGKVVLVRSKSDSEKFHAYAHKFDYEDYVYFLNQRGSSYRIIQVDGTNLMCSVFEEGAVVDASAKFYGWKIGPQEAWTLSDEWVTLGLYNAKGKSSFTWDVMQTVGIEQRDNENTGLPQHAFTDNIPGQLKSLFQTGFNPNTAKIWAEATEATWALSQTSTSKFTVEAGDCFELQQLVGTYGLWVVKSSYFMKVPVFCP